MGKYVPLGEYLANCPQIRCALSLSKIEEIIDAKLPPSAREYRQWWENYKAHVQARDGWLSVGWKVESVNKNLSTISFIRAHLVHLESGS